MKLLITAGGTSEKIDDVRSITNHSSGRLGAALGENFRVLGHEVTYVTTESAVKPQGITPILIESAEDLAACLTNLLQQKKFDAVIHAMAVSDFTVAKSFPDTEFIAALHTNVEKGETVEESFKHLLADSQPTAKKISSQAEHLVLVLKQTPKVIGLIKKLQPTTRLIGFKLLVDVEPSELIQVATASLKKNDADYIVANDLTEVTSQQHHAYLVGPRGVVAEAFTKKEIAEMLQRVLEEEAN